MHVLLGLFLMFSGVSGISGGDGSTVGETVEADTLSIDEWDVPYDASRPRDPYVGPDGLVWFVGQRADYVASFDPATGDFERYDLEPGTAPHTCIVGDDGTVWIAGNGSAYIGRLDPETGVIEKIAMPDARATDPHTMAFNSEGDIWFTLQVSNRVGFLDTETEEVEIIPVESGGARPYGLKVDANDRPWIVLFGTNKLATVDPASMDLDEVALPREEARPRRIDVTSDGGVWYVDYAEGYLGRYDPTTNVVEEWPMPGGRGARPYAMASDDQDRLWFVETGPSPNRFAGFDPATESFVSTTEVPSGGGTIRHMYFHQPTGAIWFGADTNTIGRAHVIPESNP